jgi:anti-sigma factor RsiW
MSGMHLSAEELQQYALNKAACTAESMVHLEACPDCQADVAAYTLLMEGLRQQPKPAFDFDVAAVLMERLATEQGMKTLLKPEPGTMERRKADRLYHYGMAALILVMTVIPAWLFRRSAYFVFTDIQAVFLYPILAAAGMILLWKILELYKKYQNVFNIINK